MTLRMKNTLCITIAILLSALFLTAGKFGGDRIRQAASESELKKELQSVLPQIEEFSVSLPDGTMPDSVKEIYLSGEGVIVRLNVSGYASGLEILCGIRDGKISGVRCVSSRETLGVENTYGESFKGKDADSASRTETVSGATKTTSAYKKAVLDALSVYEKLAN